MSRPTHAERMQNWERATAARVQWAQAIREGRPHYFVNAKWESYRAIAGHAFDDIERQAAREEGVPS